MNKYLILLWSLVISACCVSAQQADRASLCPVKRWLGEMSGTEFANKFEGDTINFSIPDSDNAYLESFMLLVPDTIWIKNKPLNKPAQERKHFLLHKNFEGVPGWGVNSHREYTKGSSLEGRYYILQGSLTEDIPYKGKTDYVLLEDCSTHKIIKWDPSKLENNGIIIFSPSISRHLSLMKENDFLIAENDSTYLPSKCIDVSYSIDVKNKKFLVHLIADFKTDKGKITSNNWTPKYYLKKDENKLTIQ